MEETFTDELEKIEKWIHHTSEAPIAAVIKEFLLSAREQQDFVLDPLWGEDICILVSKQLNYRLRATIHGFLTKEWTSWHAAYLSDVRGAEGSRPTSADTWVADLIVHI